MAELVHVRKEFAVVPSFIIFFPFYGLRPKSRRGKDWRDQEARRTLVSVLGVMNLTGTLSSSNVEVVSKNLNDDLLDACLGSQRCLKQGNSQS